MSPARVHSAPPPIDNSSLAANLRQLTRLRWLLIAGCAALLLTAVAGAGLVVDSLAAWLVLTVYGLMNLLLQSRLKTECRVSEWRFAGQLTLDLVLIGAFLALTGGAANPFTLLFLVPVVISTATLTSGPVWFITLLATTAYTLLLLGFPLTEGSHASRHTGFEGHVLGMWLGLVFVAALVAYFAAWMGRSLRTTERELAAARERQLRDERVLALGSLAATAAHELGSPLSTIAILAGELADDATPDQHARIQLLRAQIDHCKTLLATLGKHDGMARAEGGHMIELTELPRRVTGQVRRARPDADLQLIWMDAPPATRIVVDQSLLNALSGLVMNAVEAAPVGVTLHCECNTEGLLLKIEDRGPGMNQDLIDQIGREPILRNGREGGLGIGSLLARSVIERLGGQVDWLLPAGGGTVVRVQLPLLPLAVTDFAQPAVAPS